MYISRVKSKGNYYFYVYAYVRQDKKQIIESLGRREKAIQSLSDWKENTNKIPAYLIDKGCNEKHIDVWLKKLEAV